MASLHFDFRAPSTRPTVWGVLLLLIGLVALGASLISMQQTRHAHEARAEQLAALEQTLQQRKPARRAAARSTTGDAAQLARARVRASLDYSWQPAFAALQATFTPRIALISLEGSQAKKQLRVVGEARQLADAVAYANKLSLQPGVLGTALLQHEMQERDPQRPVRFTLMMEMRP